MTDPDRVVEIVREFIEKNKITCPETISQCDWVIENAYDLIEDLADEVGYYEVDDEDGEDELIDEL